ncbi:uncharacterized protein PHALS_09768 [Plasmopara halstedii]|uniref:Uncharacterized protein n=1 Tax=Plasmopara halstedii TaxID=4781 RepID=A0A0P1AFK8_PLAHL|nr:uncharacterized protein PHALS_09768 [Plasmopara halstedii]CEG39526.1 hypothetical protein PHALS_09768 [Plasmopara halstedii]|eukprot:XP_024575895.1 hypothetical protein PHALS_09768 [Plasmopara halstedii]
MSQYSYPLVLVSKTSRSFINEGSRKPILRIQRIWDNIVSNYHVLVHISLSRDGIIDDFDLLWLVL